MKIIIIGDNLGGGSARLGRVLIEDIAKRIGWDNLAVLGNPRIGLDVKNRAQCIEYTELKSSLLPRFIQRYIFARKFTKDDVVLNLTNFPLGTVFLRVEKEICLLHNAYFFTTPANFRSLGLKFILRDILARRFIFRFLNMFSAASKTEFVVQTPWMKILARNSIPARFKLEFSRLHGWPHCSTLGGEGSSFDQKVEPGEEAVWFYPATGEPHKNHSLLFEMFAVALKARPHMKLVVTLPLGDVFTSKLVALSEVLGIENSVINVGWVHEDQKNYLLKTCSGVVFLSEFESLGIPLLEIRELGKAAIVIKSNASEYILGSGPYIFDLRSKDAFRRKAEQERFIGMLSSSPIPSFEYRGKNLVSISDSYLFDWIGGYV